MSALIHTPERKKRCGCILGANPGNSAPFPPPPRPYPRAATPLAHREGGEKFNYKKVLAFRQFGFSRDISSRISPRSLYLYLPSRFHPPVSHLAVPSFRPLPFARFLSLSLSLEVGSLATVARVSVVYSSPPRTTHTPRHPRSFPTAASPLAAHAFYKAPLYNILLIMR